MAYMQQIDPWSTGLRGEQVKRVHAYLKYWASEAGVNREIVPDLETLHAELGRSTDEQTDRDKVNRRWEGLCMVKLRRGLNSPWTCWVVLPQALLDSADDETILDLGELESFEHWRTQPDATNGMKEFVPIKSGETITLAEMITQEPVVDPHEMDDLSHRMEFDEDVGEWLTLRLGAK